MRKTMEKEIEQWKAVKEDARYVIYDLNNLLRSETTRKQVNELKNRSKKSLEELQVNSREMGKGFGWKYVRKRERKKDSKK